MLLKRCVFKCLLKVAVEVVSHSDCGRLFHDLGPATEKALEPMRNVQINFGINFSLKI